MCIPQRHRRFPQRQNRPHPTPGHYDFEYGGCYSIKKYTSEKKYDPETGEWTHESIILHPLNKDYPPIQIQNEEGFIVIGEFIGTIQ